jgi:hypothetical protein
VAEVEITDFDLKKKDKEEKIQQLREQAATAKVSAAMLLPEHKFTSI